MSDELSAPNPADATEPSRAAIDELLGTSRPPPWWRRPWAWVAIVLVVAAGVAAVQWQRGRAERVQPQFVTEPVRRGTLAVDVVADGTLQPTRSVNIGSELSGTVSEVLVDVNDRVGTGQVLVRLDTSKLSAQVTRSRAALASAQARQAQAQATLTEARAVLERYAEVARLSGGKVPAKTEVDTATATRDRAEADLAAAAAAVVDARAALSSDETNLAKASIRSPIDGVVLSRSVEPGNAVAASLQAVTLLTIALDLAQMQLQVNVDEADVGKVEVGQQARFTVAAYPGRQFPARVTRVAFGSTTTDNVVTYRTDLDVANPDLSLRPGMTATATIAVLRREDALLVPNTALRFVPSEGAPAGAGGASGGGGLVAQLMPRPPRSVRNGSRRPAGPGDAGAAAEARARQVYRLEQGRPVAVAVRVLATDGRRSEVEPLHAADRLDPGTPVIVDQRSRPAP